VIVLRRRDAAGVMRRSVKPVASNGSVSNGIRQVLRDQARLPIDIGTLGDDSDLYQAGMSSHASVNVMLGLENHFDLEFPDRMLRRSVFESIASIRAAIEELRRDAS
jgi:acyl carrier protein